MPAIACDSTKRKKLSRVFLASEFAREPYASRPIEHRLDSFLRRHQLRDVLNDGTAYDGLLNCVIVNIGPAFRSGILGGGTSHAEQRVSSAGIGSWST